MGQADLGARCLSCGDGHEAARLAAELDQLNRDRRSIEAEVRTEALAQAQSRGDPALAWAAGENWHPGVMGIVASKLVETYHKPVFIVAQGKGSVRSTPGISG